MQTRTPTANGEIPRPGFGTYHLIPDDAGRPQRAGAVRGGNAPFSPRPRTAAILVEALES
jgi:hypothetical protein